MLESVEAPVHREAEPGEIVQAKPFRYSIQVRWGDCDPARIAYSPNMAAWAVQAIEEWWKRYAGADWYKISCDYGAVTPFVSWKLEFRAPVTPSYLLDCDVRLKRLGTSSISHEVKAYQADILCFEGEFVAVFADAREMKSRTPPANILAAIRKNIGRGL